MDNKLLVVAAFDSQLKVASHIAQEFLAGGWSAEVRVPQKSKKQLSKRQIGEFSNFTNVTYCSNSNETILKDCMDFSAILLIVDGPLAQAICHHFYLSLETTKYTSRPIIVTGFVGVGLFDTYIGYQRRLLSDVLFLNAKKDREDCLAVCEALGIKHGGLVVSGLPFLGALRKKDGGAKPVDTVLFAGQPDVPERIIERIYMLEEMLNYARRFPDRKVLFKPRHKPGEKTLHATAYHYETLLGSFLRGTDVPDNFQFVYGPIGEYLKRTQLFITVSSTAAFEAVEHGCHVAIVSDLGISDDFGNSYFMNSGMLCNFSDLLNDQFPTLNWEWVQSHMDVLGGGAKKIYEMTLAVREKNKDAMRLPYDLVPLQNQILIRIKLEARNQKLVRNLSNTANFFFRRAIRERRLF